MTLCTRATLPSIPIGTVTTTWSISFQRIEAASPLAAELVRCCAFLAPDAIPEELIMEALKTPFPGTEGSEYELPRRIIPPIQVSPGLDQKYFDTPTPGLHQH